MSEEILLNSNDFNGEAPLNDEDDRIDAGELVVPNKNSISSYVLVNEDIKVSKIKCDSILYSNLAEAATNRSKPQTSTLIYTKYEKAGSKSGINAEYYSPTSLLNGNIYMVYRKTARQSYYDFICQMKGYNRFKDYNIRSDENYHYLVTVPRVINGEYQYYYYENLNADLSQQFEKVKWDTWSICSIEELVNTDEEEEDVKTIYQVTSNVWTLGLNMEAPTISQNINVSSWDTLGQYPKFSMGQRNYLSSTFTSFLGKIQEWQAEGDSFKKCSYTERDLKYGDKYSREVDKMNDWKQFISDGELKLLKDNKGNSWIVYITDIPTYSMKTMSNSQPTVISFNWKEAEDIDMVSIVKLGE